MTLILHKDTLAVLHIFEMCGIKEGLLSIINPKHLTFNDSFIIISPKVNTENLISEIYIFNSSVLFF